MVEIKEKMITLNRNHATPLKEQLQSWVTQQIQSGSLETGSQIPSINALAEKFEISRETVRLSLDKLVSRGFLIPEQGKGYFVAPRKKRVLRIALLAKISGVYVRPIYEGLQSVLGEETSIFLVDLQASKSWIPTIQSLAYHHSIDRLLIVPPRGKEEDLSRDLKTFRRYFKIAWFDRSPQTTKDSTFLCDYDRCVQLGLEYFEKVGIHKRVYFSRAPEDRSVFSRMRKSFIQFEKARKLTPVLIKDWKEVMEQLKKNSSKQPLGVMTETDAEAVHLQTELFRNGVSVPKEVSIISCDNTELTDLVAPSISAVDPQFKELGKQAGLWIKEEEASDSPLHFVAKPLFIKKESCIS